MKIKDLVSAYMAREQNIGLFVERPQLTACLIEASRRYSTYGQIKAVVVVAPTAPADYTPETVQAITDETDLNQVEWGVIEPLFRLYVERDTAKVIEATRGFGVEAVGRDSATVQADISTFESETLPRLAFESEPFSVGME